MKPSKGVSDFLCGLLFMSALILAGSDGIYFPLPNLAGIALLMVFAVMANVRSRPESSNKPYRARPRYGRRQSLFSSRPPVAVITGAPPPPMIPEKGCCRLPPVCGGTLWVNGA